jgi:hypothetical protein
MATPSAPFTTHYSLSPNHLTLHTLQVLTVLLNKLQIKQFCKHLICNKLDHSYTKFIENIAKHIKLQVQCTNFHNESSNVTNPNITYYKFDNANNLSWYCTIISTVFLKIVSWKSTYLRRVFKFGHKCSSILSVITLHIWLSGKL